MRAFHLLLFCCRLAAVGAQGDAGEIDAAIAAISEGGGGGGRMGMGMGKGMDGMGMGKGKGVGGSASSAGLQPGNMVTIKAGCGIPKQSATITARVESSGEWVVELRNGRLRSFPDSCLIESHRDNAALKAENDKLRELLQLLGNDGDFDYYAESNMNLRMRIKDRIRAAKAEEQLPGGDFVDYGHYMLPPSYSPPPVYLPPQTYVAPQYQAYRTLANPVPLPHATYLDEYAPAPVPPAYRALPHATYLDEYAPAPVPPAYRTLANPVPLTHTTYHDEYAPAPVPPVFSQYVGTTPNPAFAHSQYVYEPQTQPLYQ